MLLCHVWNRGDRPYFGNNINLDRFWLFFGVDNFNTLRNSKPQYIPSTIMRWHYCDVIQDDIFASELLTDLHISSSTYVYICTLFVLYAVLSIISTAYHLLSSSRATRLLLNWLIDRLINFSTLSHTIMFFWAWCKTLVIIADLNALVPVHSGHYTRVKFTKRKTRIHHTTTAFESSWSYKWKYCGRRCIKLAANLDDWKRWLNVERAKLDHAAVTSVSGVVVSWRASRPAVDIVNTLYDLDIALTIMTFCCC